MSTIKQLKLEDLVKALMAIKGATPATFVALTEVKMNKTGNPYFGRVTKKQKSNVFINFDYEKSVNNALKKEGKEPNFVAQPRTWGQKIPGTPLVLHKGEYYLEARFLHNEPKVEYYLDDEVTDKTLFESYLPVTKEGPSKQGLDEDIAIRTFKITNIHEITFDGVTYVRTDIHETIKS